MAFRLGKFSGVEILLEVDDAARSSPLWQYALKPGIHIASRVAAVGQGLVSGFRLGSARRPAEVPAAPVSPEKRQILDRIAGIDWFHTIPLPHGVITPGLYDHGPLLCHYAVPELKGMRVVDIGPGDGFWAFEFEKRGASEVVALDIARVGDLDLPPDIRASMESAALDAPMGRGFSVARELLGSKVRREVLNVYQISPERIGSFDFAFCGDLLAMLMNPMKALQQLRSVVTGHALIVDFFNPYIPRMHMLYQGARQGCTWWSLSLSALERMILDAGFRKVELAGKFKAGQRGGRAWMWRAAFRAWP